MMLIILAILTFFLGGSHGLPIVETIQERVPAVISDKAEAKSILEHAQKMESVSSEAFEQLTKDLEAWSKIDRNHSAGREALDKALEKSLNERKTAHTVFFDELFEIRSKLTEAQWNALFENAHKNATDTQDS